MATFNIDDWVQVTPQPDKRWGEWTDVHDNFCGKVGRIMDEFEDPDTGEVFYNVNVNFPFGLDKAPAGWYYIHFKGDHLIHSTRYDSELSAHFERVAKELQEWEDFKKRSTDDMLRHVFAKPKRTELSDEIRRVEEERSDIPEDIDWEEDTQEIIPLPGSVDIDSLDYDDDDIDYLLQQYSSDPHISSILGDDKDKP